LRCKVNQVEGADLVGEAEEDFFGGRSLRRVG
jgi:hypothetical protein